MTLNILSDTEKTTVEKNQLPVKHELRNVKFYHGVQTTEDVVNIMREANVGDYLIRAKLLKNEVALSLFFCVKVSDRDDDIHHYLLDFKEGNGFILRQEMNQVSNDKKKCHDSGPFENYEKMIQHFKTHRLSCGIRLGQALKRPKWQLRHSSIQYEESGKLGSGNFCFVYKGMVKVKNEGWKDAAIKISKSTEKDPAEVMETRNLLVAEAKMMINYNHSNVVKLYGLACDMPPFMVCLEFCGGGTLEGLLYKHGTDMEEFEKQVVLFEAARGMRYLHTQKCVHRDLASRNCLIDFDGHVKIADFGLSKSLAADQTAFKEALKEAPLVWLAPECIQKESEFSSKTDVWAFGVLIYEVYYNGAKPFADEKNDGVIVKAIRKAKMPTLENRTKVVKMLSLHSAIWVRKPEDRPDFQKIVELLLDMFELPLNVENLRRFQMNLLKGVTRKDLPNTDLEHDQVVAVPTTNFDVSERMKKMEKAKRVVLVDKSTKVHKKPNSNKMPASDSSTEPTTGSKKKKKSVKKSITKSSGSSDAGNPVVVKDNNNINNSNSNNNKIDCSERTVVGSMKKKKKKSSVKKVLAKLVPTGASNANSSNEPSDPTLAGSQRKKKKKSITDEPRSGK